MNVLVTGATSGIGRALCAAYSYRGDHVHACGRSEAKLADLASEVEITQSYCFDLTDFEAYPKMTSEFETLDLLILNAGDCEYIDDPKHFDGELFERVVKVNLISIGYCLQTWLPHLKPGGRLVLISSSAAFLPLPRAEAYGCSKAALSYLGKTLSVSLRDKQIGVSVVHPGFVKTPLTDKNTFAMPMLIDANRAAELIVEGVNKGKREINFPWLFVLFMKCFNALPMFLWSKLAVMGKIK